MSEVDPVPQRAAGVSRPDGYVAVLHAAIAREAPPDEQDVLEQVCTVCEALRRTGHSAEPVPLTLDLEAIRSRFSRRRPRFVFNLVEAVAGSGRLIHLAPALLEELGLAYTGAPLASMFLSSNKLLAKRLFALNGIPTPAWDDGGGDDGEAIAAGQAWIVKSVWEHASIGLDDGALVYAPARPADALQHRRARFGGDWFVERYVHGREINLSLLAGPAGFEALPAAEIRFEAFPPGKPRIVGYPAKWDVRSFEYRHTVRSFTFPAEDLSLLGRLEALARRCAALLEVRGYARVDFRIDEAGNPWVLEVNANPCLAPDAGFAVAARKAGLSYDEVIGRIVDDALLRDRARAAAGAAIAQSRGHA